MEKGGNTIDYNVWKDSLLKEHYGEEEFIPKNKILITRNYQCLQLMEMIVSILMMGIGWMDKDMEEVYNKEILIFILETLLKITGKGMETMLIN